MQLTKVTERYIAKYKYQTIHYHLFLQQNILNPWQYDVDVFSPTQNTRSMGLA